MCQAPTRELCITKEVDPDQVVIHLRQIYRNGVNIAQGCGLSKLNPVPHKEIKVNFIYFLQGIDT